MPSYGSFFGEGSPTRIDYRKKGTLIFSSLLEDLDMIGSWLLLFGDEKGANLVSTTKSRG